MLVTDGNEKFGDNLELTIRLHYIRAKMYIFNVIQVHVLESFIKQLSRYQFRCYACHVKVNVVTVTRYNLEYRNVFSVV